MLKAGGNATMKTKLFIVSFLWVSMLFAGDTGKIVGQITDSETGEALFGVNILLKGSSMGSASDMEGHYIILNVPAASYTISASYIGYKTITITDIRVNADRTTTVNFNMEISAVEGEEVIVEAKRPAIVRDQTASTTTIEDDDIVNMPVNSLDEIMTTMPGVVENENANSGIHLRGGRSGEISYLVDGFLIENALYGGMSLDIAKDAISELSLITGAFNAEYGKAMSGIVNIVTKEGTPNYHAGLTTASDQFGGNNNNWGTSRNIFNLSGPIFPGLGEIANFNITADFNKTRGYLRKNQLPRDVLTVDLDNDGEYDDGEDTYAMADITANGIPDTVELKKGTFEETGTFNDYQRITGKIVIKPIKNAKLTLGTNYYQSKGKGFSMSYRQLPDRYSTSYGTTTQSHFKLNYAITENMFFTFKGQNYSRDRHNGYKPLLNNKHELWGEEVAIPSAWADYIPGTVTAGEDMNWLSYYAEPYADYNGDGQYSPFGAAEYWNDSNGNGTWDEGEYYNDWDGDGSWTIIRDDNGDGIPDQEDYEDVDGNGEYSVGVDPRLREGDAYDGTSNYEFYGSYPVVNFYGDTIRNGYSTYHDYQWYGTSYSEYGAELTWQLNDVHQIKTGFDKKNHKISNFSGGAIGGGPFGNSSDASWVMYAFKPEESSFYIQDKMEYKEFVINVGLRYDALNPNSRYPDPSRKLLYEYGGQSYEPSDLSQLTPEQMEDADWGYAVLDDDEIPKLDNDGNYLFEAAKWASQKKKWSPRIGFGYPITDNIAFHASYGHFFDYPDLSNSYNFTNTNGSGGLAPGLTGINIDNFDFGNTYAPFPVNTADFYIPTIGSPNVKPERTVQYEFGFRAHLAETYLLSLTVYYKDIYDLISSTIYDANPSQYALYENHDYANSRGFELELRQSFKNNLAWYLNYTLSRAEGSAPNEYFHWDVAYLASVYGWHDYNRTFNMSWDQTHVLNYGVDYRHPKGFGVNIIGNYGSGLPYTPTDARGRPIDEPYSARMPSTAIVNMRAYYDLPLKLANLRLYADIDNVLDNSNVNNVFTDTGTPTESTNPNTSPMWMYRPYYWKAPRHIELGITVRL